MILNLIVAMVLLLSLVGLATTVTNAEATRAARRVLRTRRAGVIPMGCAAIVFSAAVVGLWTWYAIDVQDWRFAAIVWIPFASNLLGRLATGGDES